jgi:hypothetical protein
MASVLTAAAVPTESANFVSLVFCVLDNNIRNFKCVLSGADFTAQEMTKSLGLFQAGYSGQGPDIPPSLRGIKNG